MELRKHYSVAEQEMVIELYEESRKTLKEFCESEGLEPKKLERWLRERSARKKAGPPEAVRLVEVEERREEPKQPKPRGAEKYRLGFGNGAWLEVEGGFDAEAIRALAKIVREEAGC